MPHGAVERRAAPYAMKTFKLERARDRPVNFPGAADTIAFANNFWIGHAFLGFGVGLHRCVEFYGNESCRGRNERNSG